MQITPNLIVQSIERALPFYEKLGFTKTVEVKHPPDATEGPLGFVILNHGETQLMMQSRDSIAADVAGLEKDSYRAMLYVHVDALAPIRDALASWPKVVPERTTFYGAREIIVRDTDGNVLAFAERVAS
jgi:uncharacterized glyoxalase superfamily protein PhnB